MRSSVLRFFFILLFVILALPVLAKEEPSPTPTREEPLPFFPDLPRPDKTPEPQASSSPSSSPSSAPSLQQEMQIRCFENLSRTQMLLEVYALNNEFQYPEDLEKLESWLNRDFSRKTEKHLSVPLDPVIQKNFLYIRSEDGLTYTLSPPAPDKYGLPDFSFSNFPWVSSEKIGTLKREAEKWKKERPLFDCERNLKKLQDALERFYVDNQGVYPVSLEKLLPKYLKEIPACPSSGNAYIYQKKRNGKQFEISCPNPAEHNLQELKITSGSGLIKK